MISRPVDIVQRLTTPLSSPSIHSSSNFSPLALFLIPIFPLAYIYIPRVHVPHKNALAHLNASRKSLAIYSTPLLRPTTKEPQPSISHNSSLSPRHQKKNKKKTTASLPSNARARILPPRVRGTSFPLLICGDKTISRARACIIYTHKGGVSPTFRLSLSLCIRPFEVVVVVPFESPRVLKRLRERSNENTQRAVRVHSQKTRTEQS